MITGQWADKKTGPMLHYYLANIKHVGPASRQLSSIITFSLSDFACRLIRSALMLAQCCRRCTNPFYPLAQCIIFDGVLAATIRNFVNDFNYINNTRHWTNVSLMLVHRLRRWTNIKLTLVQRPMPISVISRINIFLLLLRCVQLGFNTPFDPTSTLAWWHVDDAFIFNYNTAILSKSSNCTGTT